MLNVRPFSWALWSMLFLTMGGGLVLYGMRVREGNRITYAQMIERDADMSQHKADPIDPADKPTLELWDVGQTIIYVGYLLAIPGGFMLLASVVTLTVYKALPEPPPEPARQEEVEADGAKNVPVDASDQPTDQRSPTMESQSGSQVSPVSAPFEPPEYIELEPPRPAGTPPPVAPN